MGLISERESSRIHEGVLTTHDQKGIGLADKFMQTSSLTYGRRTHANNRIDIDIVPFPLSRAVVVSERVSRDAAFPPNSCSTLSGAYRLINRTQQSAIVHLSVRYVNRVNGTDTTWSRVHDAVFGLHRIIPTMTTAMRTRLQPTCSRRRQPRPRPRRPRRPRRRQSHR